MKQNCCEENNPRNALIGQNLLMNYNLYSHSYNHDPNILIY